MLFIGTICGVLDFPWCFIVILTITYRLFSENVASLFASEIRCIFSLPIIIIVVTSFTVSARFSACLSINQYFENQLPRFQSKNSTAETTE